MCCSSYCVIFSAFLYLFKCHLSSWIWKSIEVQFNWSRKKAGSLPDARSLARLSTDFRSHCTLPLIRKIHSRVGYLPEKLSKFRWKIKTLIFAFQSRKTWCQFTTGQNKVTSSSVFISRQVGFLEQPDVAQRFGPLKLGNSSSCLWSAAGDSWP